MAIISGSIGSTKTTSPKVVIPFYLYAALSFLVATVLLFTSGEAFLGHYFHSQILAITHIMALGWGTMIILGASHQLVPVVVEGRLYSERLAYLSFSLTAIGIPLLAYSFYIFDMGHLAKWGGRFVLLGILCYLINLAVSISKGKSENVHAIFVLSSVAWLFITAFLGLVLVYSFTYPTLLKHNTLHYLPLHVHAGIVGWFLLLVIGVGSRLIPMFLISKYQNKRLLWLVFFLINVGILLYFFKFYYLKNPWITFLPVALILTAILLFAVYCLKAYGQRIRKQVDDQMKMSLLSVVMMVIPVIILMGIIGFIMLFKGENLPLTLAYGFLIFFGWLTAIILGMTFKTLPFVVWNKVYHHQSASGKTPNPKDLFSQSLFRLMSVAYLAGVFTFVTGILLTSLIWIQFGAALLIIASASYSINVLTVVNHKAKAV